MVDSWPFLTADDVNVIFITIIGEIYSGQESQSVASHSVLRWGSPLSKLLSMAMMVTIMVWQANNAPTCSTLSVISGQIVRM